MERWEEGFGSWRPDDTARLEPLKQALREAAEAVAAKRRELVELRRQIEAELAAARAERELAAAERDRLEQRERTIHEVEKELAGLRVELDAREAALAERERAEPASLEEDLERRARERAAESS